LIGKFYEDGTLVEKDVSKVFKFLEVAAKRGDALAHNLLALYEEDIGNMNKSIKHLKVAASAGHKKSMDALMNLYRDKLLSKDELTQTLRAYQASNDLTKSQERDDARELKQTLANDIDAMKNEKQDGR